MRFEVFFRVLWGCSVLLILSASVPAARPPAGPEDEAKILSRAKMTPPPGFALTLFAHPPDIGYPTCLAAAPTGELFVGVDEDGSLGKDPGKGWVVRCIDSTGQGKADKFNVFAKMDHPRGIVYDNGTLYVLHPPFLTAYYDDNGTGVSSRSEELITGISTEMVKSRGADHTTNGIRMGIDGWIYIAMGDFGCKKAVAKDGTQLQMHCGGIVRIRPDGTGLEAYCHGTRNIYDVAIDPFMNVFTRDNTNDGDNWNDRLAFDVPTGNYGYPSLFMHFPGEFVDCLADYGGGAPCGSLFLDEPGFPGDFGHGLYTVEWGNNVVDRHPLTPDGAGFKAGREKFINLPRGTDIDVDGQSHLYLSSWEGGGFAYSGPHVGFVVRLAPAGYQAPVFSDLKKASEIELVKALASPSAFLRQAAQRQLLDRKQLDKSAAAAELEKLAGSDSLLAGRVAAVLTLPQLLGRGADAALLRLEKKDDLREYALRALADHKDDKAAPSAPFIEALSDASPRVRLQAAWGLGRLGTAQAAGALLPHVADPDFLVAHVTVNSLVALHATDACLKGVDPTAPTIAPGALRALQLQHEVSVVDGLTERLKGVTEPGLRSLIYGALCRLYYREADWDGSWWGTRPDTSGPYFKNAEWEGTDKVKEVLQSALSSENSQVLRNLLISLQKHKIQFPGLTEIVGKYASKDPSFKEVMLDLFTSNKDLTSDQIALVLPLASAADEKPEVRVKAIRLLKRGTGEPSLQATVDALSIVITEEKAPAQVRAAAQEFLEESREAKQARYFVKLTGDASAPKRELAYAVLLKVAGHKLVKPEVKAEAAKAVDAAWNRPQTAVSLLQAIGYTRADGYAAKVDALKKDGSPEVAQAATAAAARLGPAGAAPSGKPLIETLSYEQVVAEAQKLHGNLNRGKELFSKQGCIVCHTVSAEEPPKGPFLGGIALRYSRAELCESILKPSAKIAQGFETQVFKLKSGDVLDGFVSRESGDDLELRTATGAATVIKKSDIVKRGKRDTSIMPEGLAAQLTTEDLASILAYLESLKAN